MPGSPVLFLLGCATRQPPTLYPDTLPRADVAPLEVAPLETGECRAELAMAPGDQAPCVGVLIPGGGPYGLGAYLEHQRRDLALTPALAECYAGRAEDRAWAVDRHAALWTAYDAADREARMRRAVGALGIVGGVLAGVGLTLGVYWTADGL